MSKGPQEAAIPVVTNLTQDQAVLQDESVTLSISAYSTDDGTLRYAWYMSTNGSYENAALVSRSREGNTTCEADTSVPGTYYYFCVVENSFGDDTKTTKSNMIEVVVQEKTVEKPSRSISRARVVCMRSPSMSMVCCNTARPLCRSRTTVP